MADVAIIIVTHGNFGKELLKSVEMIMGEQKDVFVFGLNLGDDVESLRDNVKRIVDENQRENKEIVVLVDVFGGSPSNIALSLLEHYDVKVIVGVNMPILIEILSCRNNCGIEDLVERGYRAGIDGIKKIDISSMKHVKNRSGG
jgi:PTS system mannose-specific IIA component